MLFPSRAYRAALNALLVEHDLGYIELIPENPFAAKLRNGIIDAMRVGSPTSFDENSWLATFNHAERVVQLNFVAFGFNELGMSPMLKGAEWQSVQNPLVIRNIETNLDKAARYIQRKSGEIVRLRQSKLSLEKWGLADLEGAPRI